MLIAAALALAPVLATSSVLVVDPFAADSRARASAHLDEMVGEADSVDAARTALRLATADGTPAAPSQAWHALRAVAGHDDEVERRMEALLPALPVVTGAGSAAPLAHAYEQALRDAGAVPLTTMPGRRRGVLEVHLSLRPNGAARPGEEQSWILEATAHLKPVGAGAAVLATTRTIVSARHARDVAERAPAASAAALARALVTELGQSAHTQRAEAATTSRRTAETVADLRDRARRDARVKAVLAAFPAQLVVDVSGRDAATTAAWDKALESAFVDVSRNGLPVVLGPADYQVRVQTAVSALERRKTHGGATTSAAWTVRSTVQLTTRDGRVLAEIHHDAEVQGHTAADAARTSAVKVARAGYDTFVEQVAARINRLGQRRASR